MPQIYIQDPQGGEQQLQIDRGEYIIGRDPANPITLPDRKVSRNHARVYGHGTDWWVEDLGSSNGVVIGGVATRGPQQLAPGTVFEIGNYRLTFVVDEVAGDAQVTLQGLTPPVQEQAFLLPLGNLSVGRSDDNDIPIPHSSMSRKHAALQVGANGVAVEDFDSSNGTWVNGVKVGRRILNQGDLLRFGSVEFEVITGGSRGPALTADSSMVWALTLGAVVVILLGITAVVVAQRMSNQTTSIGAPNTAYEQQLQGGLLAAREHMRNQAWGPALSAYQQVLERDPINREARTGALAARTNAEQQREVESARRSLREGHPEEAFRTLAKIPSSAYYGSVTTALRKQTKVALATRAIEAARPYCKRREWKACQLGLATHLDYQPDSAAGKKLLDEAEAALAKKGQHFVPWTPPPALTVHGVQPVTFEQRYTNKAVRTVAQEYATGDLEGAIASVRAVDTAPGGAMLGALLTTVRDAKTSGDSAALSGDTQRALRAWQDALETDARIVPHGEKSKLRTLTGQRVADEVHRRAQVSMQAGRFQDAYRLWELGLRHSPNNPQLLAGLGQLEDHAESLYRSVASAPQLTVEICQQIAAITAMTRPTSTIHQAAARRGATCR